MKTIHQDDSHERHSKLHSDVPLSIEPDEVNPVCSADEATVPASDLKPDSTLSNTNNSVSDELTISDHQLVKVPSAIAIYSPPAALPQERRSSLSRLLLTTGLLVAVVGGAIGGLYIRAAQYEKMAQARLFLDDACHAETILNPGELSLAKQTWTHAENLLQTVPPLPGLGINDAQALRSTYSRCKQNLDATGYVLEASQISGNARNAVAQSPIISEDAWTNHLRQLDAAIEHLRLAQAAPTDLPIFAEAQRRLGEYQTIRIKAQTQFNQESQAVENFQKAQDLHKQFQIRQVSADVTSRALAEENLQTAIATLKKIPPEGTTVSTSASLALAQYSQELEDFRAEPARQYLRLLAGNFAQLGRDLQSNLTFDDATSAALDNLARQVAQAQQEPKTNGHPALPYFVRALEDYQFAQTLWKDCNEQTPESDLCFRNWFGGDDLYLGNGSRLHNHLVDYYRVSPTIYPGSIRQKSALEAIFEHAQQQSEQATQRIER